MRLPYVTTLLWVSCLALTDFDLHILIGDLVVVGLSKWHHIKAILWSRLSFIATLPITLSILFYGKYYICMSSANNWRVESAKRSESREVR
jgi:hypothetical protein